MIKMNRSEAFSRLTALYGKWNTWDRSIHLAYGLLRGVPYAKMEASANDNPHATLFEYVMWRVGAWPDHPHIATDGYRRAIDRTLKQEAESLVVWVKKTPRVKHFAVIE